MIANIELVPLKFPCSAWIATILVVNSCLAQAELEKHKLRAELRNEFGPGAISHAEPIQVIAESSDGRLLAIGGGMDLCSAETQSQAIARRFMDVAWKYEDVTIAIWDLKKKEVVHRLRGHSIGIASVSFSPDGQKLVSSAFDGTLKCWNVTKNECIWTESTVRDDVILTTNISSDGRALITGSTYGTITVWDLETGTRRRDWYGRLGRVRRLAFANDGNTLVGQVFDKRRGRSQICAWDFEELGEPVWESDYTPGFVSSRAAISRDGKLVAVPTGLSSIVIYDVKSGEASITLNGRRSKSCSLEFTLDNHGLLQRTENELICWDLKQRTSKVRATNLWRSPAVVCGADNKTVFTSDWTKLVMIRGADDKLHNSGAFHRGGKTALLMAGDTLVSTDGTQLNLWQLNPVARKQTVAFAQNNVKHQLINEWSFAVLAADRRENELLVARNDLDRELELFALTSGKRVGRVRCGRYFDRLAISTDGNRIWMINPPLACGVISNYRGDAAITSLRLPTRVEKVAVTSDGVLAATARLPNRIAVWKAPNMEPIQTFLFKHDGSLYGNPAIAANASHVAAFQTRHVVEGILSVGDVGTGRLLKSVSLKERVTALAFSEDGTNLAFGTDMGNLGVYQVAHEKVVLSFKAHPCPITSITYDDTSFRLFTVGADGRLREWRFLK